MNHITNFLTRRTSFQRLDDVPTNQFNGYVPKDAFDEPIPLAACRSGNLEVLKTELTKDPNAVFRQYRSGKTEAMSTLLQLAAQEGHLEVCKVLTEKGADTSAEGTNNATPLLAACQNGHLDTVEHLLKNNADPNWSRNDGLTALYIASQNGHHQIVEQLLNNHADVNKARNNGSSPLQVASLKGHTKVVEALLSKNADPDRTFGKGFTPILAAVQNGHHKVVELLINNGANINKLCDNGCSPLFIAASRGDVKTVKLLLESGANIESGWGKLGTNSLTPSALSEAKKCGFDKSVVTILQSAIKARKSIRIVAEETRSLLSESPQLSHIPFR